MRKYSRVLGGDDSNSSPNAGQTALLCVKQMTPFPVPTSRHYWKPIRHGGLRFMVYLLLGWGRKFEASPAPIIYTLRGKTLQQPPSRPIFGRLRVMKSIPQYVPRVGGKMPGIYFVLCPNSPPSCVYVLLLGVPFLASFLCATPIFLRDFDSPSSFFVCSIESRCSPSPNGRPIFYSSKTLRMVTSATLVTVEAPTMVSPREAVATKSRFFCLESTAKMLGYSGLRFRPRS